MLFGSSRSDETEMTCKSKLEFKVEVLLCTASSDLMRVQLMYILCVCVCQLEAELSRCNEMKKDHLPRLTNAIRDDKQSQTA